MPEIDGLLAIALAYNATISGLEIDGLPAVLYFTADQSMFWNTLIVSGRSVFM